ncbi:nitrogen fixation protein NifB [Vibrio xiamenensis]|uniref:FeMo cofactor biosynthesis protein NifB n=1 Tax=Vibrio xiamenensis TaxID=861298 RepID=A0A1G8D413_9VIBR|nr:nitrogenase cofactor biosynthesis protein NifB [Vibrio xiamenensis]SDH51910.1 nitrogen fixation protein NifB [Vibrio xiamenensis]
MNIETAQPENKIKHFIGRDTQKRIEDHPCYSKNAAQYARIHLPVAPACNIQCNYCNRKFDCSNESRPGVVSNLLEPIAGLARFHSIKQRMPNLTVVGIAGPGDALANPKQTFATLKMVQKADPSVKLCISTNGLMLPDYVEELKDANVDHLTITINAVDPNIGARIYPWVYYNHQRHYGLEAAQILLDRQMLGLKMACDAGLLVKVNTVLIPGVNDHHIAELSHELKQRGAFLHNIMPLISEPEHGTFFGLNYVKGPNEQQIATARSSSSLSMPQMSHCQQCRADAVGTLTESGGGCSSKAGNSEDRYRVAVATKGSQIIDTHFGHATGFDVYEIEGNDIRFVEHRKAEQYCHGESECREEQGETLFERLSDCDEVLSVRIGITPWKALEEHGVKPNVDLAYMHVEQALGMIADEQMKLASDQNGSEQQAS